MNKIRDALETTNQFLEDAFFLLFPIFVALLTITGLIILFVEIFLEPI